MAKKYTLGEHVLKKYTLMGVTSPYPQLMVHGNTQNNNESLNGIIWKRCPKYIFVSRLVIEMGVSSAITNFNSSIYGILGILNGCNIGIGAYTELFFGETDRQR